MAWFNGQVNLQVNVYEDPEQYYGNDECDMWCEECDMCDWECSVCDECDICRDP